MTASSSNERAAPDALRIGTVIDGKYEIARVLGRGGLGVVYAAQHLKLGREVAVKFLSAASANDDRVAARFAREARAAAKITSEHVARVYDVSTLDGAPFIVMEYLEGRDLASLLEEQGRLSASDASAYLLQACEAIAEAHALGIVHRDLKPSNLFITRRRDGSPCVKVLDFGISKMLYEDAGITSEDSSVGSPAYMSPEQLLFAREVDARSDIWSLGVVLYELVTGKRPFSAASQALLCMKVLNDEPTAPSGVVPDLSKAVDAVVARCLKKNRADRYAGVAALADALSALAPPEAQPSVARIHRIAAHGEVSANTLESGIVSTRPPRKSSRVVWWSLLAVAGGGAAVALVTRNPNEAHAPAPEPEETAAVDAPEATPSKETVAPLPLPSALPSASVAVRVAPPPPARTAEPTASPSASSSGRTPIPGDRK